MKKGNLKIKNLTLIMLLVTIMFLLSGCAFMDSSFFVKLSDEDTNNKYIDILIPLETSDEFYTEYNISVNCSDSGLPTMNKNSEIVRYNEAGYRSMLMHYNGTNVYYFNLADAHISLPDNLYSAYNSPYGEEAYMDFCNKYRKCKFVVINNQGNILKVSKEIKLKKFGYYLNDVTKWNTENNIIKVSYHISPDRFVVYLICCAVSVIGVLLHIILWKIYNKRCDKGKYNCFIIVVLSALITLFSISNIFENIISLFLNTKLSADIIILNSLFFIFSFVNFLFFRFFFNDIIIGANRKVASCDKDT